MLVYWLHFVDKITTILVYCYNRNAVIIQSFLEYSEHIFSTMEMP
jgi:hypothetical protein